MDDDAEATAGRPRTKRRARNPQGEGRRLREDLIAAADRILAATGDEEGLSLRAVAREAGIAAPSVYLHFSNKQELVLAVIEARFGELSAAVTQAITRAPDDPAERLRAGCLAYCRFGLDHPNAYRVLFGNLPTLAEGAAIEDLPGAQAFFILVDGVRGCIEGGQAERADAVRVATNVWTALHGIVSLRRAAAAFPWPPVTQQVDDVIRGLVGLRTDPSPPRSA